MKFTDGNWMHANGVTPHYAAQAYEVESVDGRLEIAAPCHVVGHRAATLGGAMLSVSVSSPMPDVIGVSIARGHIADRDSAQFEIRDLAPATKIAISDGDATLTSGSLTARIARGGQWRLEFLADGRCLTASPGRSLGAPETNGGPFVHEQLLLGVGESVYGFGERFTAFVKNGQVVESWNKDGGTGSDQAYKAVPFYMTSAGYGVFVREPGAVSFEVASEKVSRVQFSVPGRQLEYYVIYGPSPKEILAKYTALTGRPALPPAWSFGLWLTTSFTTSYDEATVTDVIAEMKRRELPLHVFHFDCFWMREFHWCDFEWDKRTFPDPAGMLKRLKADGLKICVWINPYIAFRSKLFAEGAAHGYLLKRPDGTVWQTDDWQPGMGIVDFTNPAACAWYAEKLAALLEMGVDCFKTDFGERIPLDVVYFDGSRPDRMHNYYSFLYNRTVFDLLREKRGEGEAVLFARSATTGGQQFPIHWGGDCDSTFESMAESLRGGLSIGLSGFGYWSHDIGGFEGMPDAGVYKRWIAFGLLSSHSRLHGSTTYRVPWLFDEESVDVLRRFTQLKCRLMPYLYAAAVEAHETGTPVMRAMFLEYPSDPASRTLDRQYMLGPSLLVAPVMSASGHVEYYLPEGTWTDFETGRQMQGPRWVSERHGYLSLPTMARPNSAIAVGAHRDVPDYDYAEGVVIHVFELADESELLVDVPDAHGAAALAVRIARRQTRIAVRATGRAVPFGVLLRGVTHAAVVDGGTGHQTELGYQVDVRGDAATIDLAGPASLNGHRTTDLSVSVGR
jgi:alpha-D-xyloside xylohydrolase